MGVLNEKRCKKIVYIRTLISLSYKHLTLSRHFILTPHYVVNAFTTMLTRICFYYAVLGKLKTIHRVDFCIFNTKCPVKG